MTATEAAPWDGLALTLPGWAGPAALVVALALALALLAWLWAGWSRATPVPPTLPLDTDRDDTCPSCGVPLTDHPSIRVWVANGRYSGYTVHPDACDEPPRLNRDDACPSCGVPLIDHPYILAGGADCYTAYLDACDEPSRLDRLDGIGRTDR